MSKQESDDLNNLFEKEPIIKEDIDFFDKEFDKINENPNLDIVQKRTEMVKLALKCYMKSEQDPYLVIYTLVNFITLYSSDPKLFLKFMDIISKNPLDVICGIDMLHKFFLKSKLGEQTEDRLC